MFDTAGHLLAEHNGATGAVQKEYIWLDDLPVAVVDWTTGSAVTYYIHTGQAGEPLVLTNASKAKVWDAWGNPWGKAGTFGTPSEAIDLRLPGQWLQLETNGLHQNWHRDYDPSIGRYAQADPTGVEAGQNLYAYASDDPLNGSDNAGLIQHVTGRTIDCGGGCWIRIDYTLDPKTNAVVRHLHWGCKRSAGECGENGLPSHGGTWEDAPQAVKDCARKHGFNGQPTPVNNPRVTIDPTTAPIDLPPFPDEPVQPPDVVLPVVITVLLIVTVVVLSPVGA